jgi:predicted AlkP superfamily pyrophosphatase or phosphodiesterase
MTNEKWKMKSRQPNPSQRTRNLRLASALALSILALSILTLGAPISPANVARQSRSSARLILIVVVDGLRPDSINREDTPTLFRLRQEGVNYVNSHSEFPTVTRVNAAVISTGHHPGVNGLVSNSMFVPGVNPNRPFNTNDHRQLLRLRDVTEGRLLFMPGMAEYLKAHSIRFAAVSSGSTGSALLLNHRAPEGVGVVVNGGFDPGKRVAYPDDVSAAILSRFGPAPSIENSAGVDWADRVLREYVLPELKPEVVIDWQTEPDGAQHRYGTSSPEARAALSNSDRNLGLTLAKVQELGLGDKTDVIVLSDHGFSLHNFRVDATRALIDAGLKASADSDDVVLASNGQSVLVHVKGRDPQRIRRIVRFLRTQGWVDVVFTSERRPAGATGGKAGPRRKTADDTGWVLGTFSLELIKQVNFHRGPDILFTLPWSSAPNEFGVAGKHYTEGSGGTGPLSGAASGHGGMSPWLIRNTLILWGPDFKRGVTVRLAAGNVDIAPTVLVLKGEAAGQSLGGRVLKEALRDGPDEEQIASETKILRTAAGRYRAAVQVTDVSASSYTTSGPYRYIDKGWRIR